jgi:hypothetical protein
LEPIGSDIGFIDLGIAPATNIFSSESDDDEVSSVPNNQNFADIINELIALKLSEDGTNSNYEPGEDD